MRKLITILILALALRLLGINWDLGFHLHPDERMLIMVADNIRFFNQLNPNFFNYGSLPIYLLKAVSQLTGFANYHDMLYVGRFLSIFFDLLTIIFIYKISKILFKEEKIALFSSFLYSISFFPIQNSHFFTMDSMLTSLTTVLIYLLILYIKKPNINKCVLLSIVYAAMMSSKFTAIIFYPIIIVVIILAIKKWNPEPEQVRFRASNLITSFLTFNFLLLTFNFLFMPYAFLDYKKFLSDVALQIKMNSNPYIFPYTLQYVGTIPYLYYLKNIFLWGLGPIISILSIIGLLSLRSRRYVGRSNLLLFFIFYILYFLIIGHSAVKFMRYMLPIYPFLAIMAGYGLYKLYKLYKLLTFFVLLVAFGWTLMFVNIYFQPHTRIAATDWILKNIPVGSTLAIEHWDDRLPLYGEQGYNFVEMTLYDQPDDNRKWQILNAKLKYADYIIIASNRLYVPLQKLVDCQKYKMCYPKTAQYYQKLFNGQLGFKKIAEFAVYPGFQISDQGADESFTVYDHPKVMIFKKTF